LITPPESSLAISTALATNPHLTTLPSPKATLLSPKDLAFDSGTAEILRLPEVRNIIGGDFVVLPCDLVCELGGDSLLAAWMVNEGGFGGATGGRKGLGQGPLMGVGGERGGRRGGLGVWYNTKGEGDVKKRKDIETDFIATSPLQTQATSPPTGSVQASLSKLVYTVPTDTLKDMTSEWQNDFAIRHAMIKKHGRVKILTSHRDAHVYFFPYWVLDMVNQNDRFDSIGEDVLGWWAKAGWQDGLGDKLGLREIFEGSDQKETEDSMDRSGVVEDEVDLNSMSTTRSSQPSTAEPLTQQFASRVSQPSSDLGNDEPLPKSKLIVPPILAYIHPSDLSAPTIQRVDTTDLLLSTSLRLAKLESIEEAGPKASPLAHATKVADSVTVPQRATVTKADSLVAENVSLAEKTMIKSSVVGANCSLQTQAKLTGCLLMDGVIIEEGVRLENCILGPRCKIGKNSTLKDCKVEGLYVVPDESKSSSSPPDINGDKIANEWFPRAAEATGESYTKFEGLEDEDGAIMEQEGEDMPNTDTAAEADDNEP
jgi:translation initiation factor eIF-2B subunit gamma